MRNTSRRHFLQTTTALGASLFVSGLPARASTSANEKLNLAIVGCGNKGWDNVVHLSHENIAFLCDIDTNMLDHAYNVHSKATKYRDYRNMFDKEAANIDAVVVSTADHNHAPATMRALDLKKPVYCEKPLTHTVAEARAITKKSIEAGVATQMGTQIHATDNYRRVVELIQAKTIGDITAVYHWCNKGWSDGRFTTTTDPVPANLDWDLFLGPAPARPYSSKVHPGDWRRFWDYGTGTFGDMACHIMDLSFWALDLTYPTRIKATGPEVHPEGTPAWCLAEYDFPANGTRPALTVYWADGGKFHDLVANTKDAKGKPLTSWGIGALFVGTNGMLAANYSDRHLLPTNQFESTKLPEPTIQNSVGHWLEWTNAIKTGSPTTCPFSYSGRLSETVLLGPAAYRAGEELIYNPTTQTVTNTQSANQYLSKPYRKGWEL